MNLARRPAENRRRVWILWGGSLAVLTALLLVLGTAALVGWRRTRAIQLQTDAVRQRMAPLLAGDRGLQAQLRDPQIRSALDQAAYFNQLLDRKSISWTRLFERLETLMPPQVELVSLKPVERQGTTAVDLVFASNELDAASQFVTQLEASGDFASAQLLHENMNPVHNERDSTQQAPLFQIEISVLYQPGLSGDSDDEVQP